MSLTDINLCSLLIKDDFGDVVEKVFVTLSRKGPTAAGIIAQNTGLKLTQVKKSLCVLIHHNLVTFELHKRGFVEYRASLPNALVRPRFPQYIYAAKTLYGDAAELLTEELLHNGQGVMSDTLYAVKEKLNEALNVAGQKPQTVYQVRDKFENLVNTHFFQRCPSADPEISKADVPVFSEEESPNMYTLPDVKLDDSRKRKRSVDESEPPAKKARTESGTKPGDMGVYWRVNFERFNRHLRDQILVAAISRKINVMAGEIFRSVLRLSELNSDVNAPVTNPLSFHEIYQGLPASLGLSRQVVEQYLRILVEDKTDFIQKIGESGGGMFRIDFQKAFTTLAKAHIESVIQERFGSKSLRIYRLLMLKKQLEQKQIEEFAMVPSKEAKELLYSMFEEHFVALTEVPKTPDHVPSRTFFLFSINVNQVARMLLQRCYKTMYNLILKKNQEISENKRLLEKQARMDAIVASLEQNGADEAQKQEIEDQITPSERTQITKVRNSTKKFSQGELQLDETIIILEMYLHYIHLK